MFSPIKTLTTTTTATRTTDIKSNLGLLPVKVGDIPFVRLAFLEPPLKDGSVFVPTVTSDLVFVQRTILEHTCQLVSVFITDSS
jgi:hypothetical protein